MPVPDALEPEELETVALVPDELELDPEVTGLVPVVGEPGVVVAAGAVLAADLEEVLPPLQPSATTASAMMDAAPLRIFKSPLHSQRRTPLWQMSSP